MSFFSRPSDGKPSVDQAQALVEFALVVPVLLLLALGLIDLGRAMVFGVSVQEGTRQAARMAATASNDATLTDAAVLGRLVAASDPALSGCQLVTTSQASPPCNTGTWTFSLSIAASGGGTYTSIAAARAANALPGAQVKVTAVGSVALLPNVQTGNYGLVLPQISVRGESAMVIL